MLVETILSLCDPVTKVANAYKAVTGLFRGDPNTRLFEELVHQNKALRFGIERLSDNILYASNMQVVTDTTRRGAQRRIDRREVREYLEPVQRALKQPILSSTLILTPEKMRRALIKNPWEVLNDVRPLGLFSARLPPEGIPVQFEHQGMRYMGWQLRGTLPLLFDCELHDLLPGPPVPVSPATTDSGPIGRRYILRSRPERLSAGHAHSMLKDKNFYDEIGNPTGRADNELTDNGDGTITDYATGLMWQQNGSGWISNFREAEKYIRKLNGKGLLFPGPPLAGYSDWRLPTLEEASSLITPDRNNKMLRISPLFSDSQHTIWTSDSTDFVGQWVVYYMQGIHEGHLHHTCVRGCRTVG